MKKLMILAAACGVLAALPAAAQFQKPEDAIKYRQSAFTVMGNHVARIGAMVQGRAPFDAKVANDSAHIVAVMSTLPFSAFGDGTDKGMPNRAKPEIWSDAAKFKAAQEEAQRVALLQIEREAREEEAREAEAREAEAAGLTSSASVGAAHSSSARGKQREGARPKDETLVHAIREANA